MNKYYHAESTTLIYSGDHFFKTLEEIVNAAKEVVHFQTYIFENDATGISIANTLKEVARRGVNVFIMVDAYGSKSLSKKFINDLKKDNIHFRFFAPLFSHESTYVGRRLHHKIVVVDKQIALVGGINIADKYHGTLLNPAWLDYAVLIKGNVCIQLHNLCEQLFEKRNFIKQQIKEEQYNNYTGNVLLRFTRNDWIRGKNEIHTSYLHALNASKKSVIFVVSYFLPGYRFRQALKKARKRGIEITIVLAGKSDLPALWYAEKYLYLFFLQNGVKVYEWKNSVLHAKAVIVDTDWVTIGSYNLNPLSHYRSIELNVQIKDQPFATTFQNHVQEIIHRDCSEITLEKSPHTINRFSRIRNSFLYYFFKFVLILLISKRNIR